MFHARPEIPAITRATLTISVTGEPPRLDLATDEARTFLLALRAGRAPVVAADTRSGFQIEFAVGDDGPAFIIGKQRTTRRFSVADVSTMVAHLLADLGP